MSDPASAGGSAPKGHDGNSNNNIAIAIEAHAIVLGLAFLIISPYSPNPLPPPSRY